MCLNKTSAKLNTFFVLIRYRILLKLLNDVISVITTKVTNDVQHHRLSSVYLAGFSTIFFYY